MLQNIHFYSLYFPIDNIIQDQFFVPFISYWTLYGVHKNGINLLCVVSFFLILINHFLMFIYDGSTIKIRLQILFVLIVVVS